MVKIRKHTHKTIDNKDDTYKVYDPDPLVGKAGLNITPSVTVQTPLPSETAGQPKISELRL
jgi:hypothetical protein